MTIDQLSSLAARPDSDGEQIPPLPAGPGAASATLDRQARPFTAESLAERWGCSAEKVRQMFHRGELAGFRLGKLIRIPAIEVERFECTLTQLADDTSSSNTEASSLSRSDAARIAADTRRELMTRA